MSGVFRAPLLVAMLAAASCSDPDGSEIAVRLETGPLGTLSSETPQESSEPLRFAYASVLSPERSLLAYAHLGRHLSNRLDREVIILRRRTYGELNELLRTGQADAGLVCSGAFAAGEDGFGLEAIAIPVIEGARTYRSYVITRRDAVFRTFDSLSGTTFAFTDPLSNTGYRYVAAKLLDEGRSPEDFFEHYVFTYGHDNSIEAVRDGLVDAGSVDSLVWDELVKRDPSLANYLVVIDRSEEFPINPVAAAPELAPDVKSALMEAFLTLNEDPEGRRLLFELGTDEFVEPSVETLAGYDAIARSWRRLAAAAGDPSR